MDYTQLANEIGQLLHQDANQASRSASHRQTLIESYGTSAAKVLLIHKRNGVATGRDAGVWFSAVDSSPELKDMFAADEFLLLDDFPALDMLQEFEVHPQRYPGLTQHLADPSKLIQSLGSSDDINMGAQGDRSLGFLLMKWYDWKEHSLWSFLDKGVQILRGLGGTH